MPRSIDVHLPKSKPPVFPDECVVCSKPNPGSACRLTTYFSSHLSPEGGFPTGRFRVEVPACDVCGCQLQQQRKLRRCLRILYFAGAFALAYWLSLPYPALEVDWHLQKLVAILIIIPISWWDVFQPLPFDLSTRGSDQVVYEFRERHNALKFIELN